MTSFTEVVQAIQFAYETFKRYCSENEDIFNMSELSELLNESFKELDELIKESGVDPDYDPEDLV